MTDEVKKPAEMSGKVFILLVALGAGVRGLARFGFRTAWRGDSRKAECRARLIALSIAAQEYHGKYHAWPAATGPAFWDAIVRGTESRVPKKIDLLHCPVTGRPYRGPSSSPDGRDPAAFIGCCEPGVHGPELLGLTQKWEFVEAKPDDPRFAATK
ncbi:MAG: hypothetical protein K8T20_07520, partial [Planctomycetes bacterium]|nr:hypothetical protein [Planctomycetota bacterium]